MEVNGSRPGGTLKWLEDAFHGGYGRVLIQHRSQQSVASFARSNRSTKLGNRVRQSRFPRSERSTVIGLDVVANGGERAVLRIWDPRSLSNVYFCPV